MSLRTKATKERGRTKMSVRDKRILNTQIADQKRSEEQEAVSEELEGLRQKTPTKRMTSARGRAKSAVYSSPFLDEREKLFGDAKAFLKKVQKKHVNVNKVAWLDTAAVRTMCSRDMWQHLSQNDAGPVKRKLGQCAAGSVPRLFHGQEHPDRSVECRFCKEQMPSDGLYCANALGECWHESCNSMYVENQK
jgi:hypothetical protein